MQSQLIGQAVSHRTFGKGVIQSQTPSVVSVLFAAGEKRFSYPDAFQEHLTLRDTALQQELSAFSAHLEQKKQAQNLTSCEGKLQLLRLQRRPVPANAQAVFHCTPAQWNDAFAQGQISAGCYISGYSKGRPRVPNRVCPSSALLLTELPAGGKEADRRIAGLALAAEDYLGEFAYDGMIFLHPEHRLLLPVEARIRFWDFFAPEERPSRWGSVPFKYFDTSLTIRVLLALKPILQNTPHAAALHSLQEAFYRQSRLPLEEV